MRGILLNSGGPSRYIPVHVPSAASADRPWLSTMCLSLEAFRWSSRLLGFSVPIISHAFRRVLRPLMDQKACVPSYDIQDNSICSNNGDCEKAEWDGMDSGSYTFDDALFVESIVIKAGVTYNIHWADPDEFETTTDDGCYRVTFSGNEVAWERIGRGPSCQSISHMDVWQAPICQ